MKRRIQALFRAYLRAQLGGEVVPAAALLSHGALIGVLCLLVRDVLGIFGYALFALAASGALIALTLLGEFGALLRADPAADWSETLPARPVERRAAHALVVVALLGSLTVGALLPAALFAPGGAALTVRLALLACGLGQAFLIAALLLGVQGLLGERAEGLLVLLQTLLVVVAVGGFLMGVRLVPWLARLEAGDEPWPPALSYVPAAWFAGAVAGPPAGAVLPGRAAVFGLALLALAALLLVPPARASAGRSTITLLSRLLSPFRRLAERVWVPRRERGVFDLVYDALPLERDFVIRTYPMIGIPLAFLFAGARGEAGAGRQGLLALLLFTPAVYLPVLLAHVPATGSAAARWILDSAPVSEATIRNAAIKALAVRFLVPLYGVLAAIAWSLGEGAFALRLAVPGFLVSLFVLRRLYPQLVLDHPLSTLPDELEVKHDWMGSLMTLAVVLVVLAIFAQRVIDTPLRAAALVAVLWSLEAASDLAARRSA